jgi:hypothetical protein
VTYDLGSASLLPSSRLGLEQPLHGQKTNHGHVDHRFAGADFDTGRDSFRSVAPFDGGADRGEAPRKQVPPVISVAMGRLVSRD